MENKKYKHLTLDDRLEIQSMLNQECSFKEIASKLGKDPSTISKEIRKHIILKNAKFTKHDLYGNKLENSCSLLLKPPYVCNACKKRYHCPKDRQVYQGIKAHNQYLQTLKISREGIILNKEYFYEVDKIIKEGIEKGQHLYHILTSNNINIPISSIYRYQQKGYLSISSMDLPRKVKFKPRKKEYIKEVPSTVKKNRTYADFLKYIDENNISNWVEMDTVIGSIGGKVLLTLNFNLCNFIVGYLMNSKSANDVVTSLNSIKLNFENFEKSFEKLVPIILTDNGGEFSNVNGIEQNPNNENKINLFFCRPMMSSDKPHIEKNHTLLRDICPKGTSFNDFSQENINLIFSHINSVKRKSLNGKSSYDVFEFTYGKEIAQLLGIQRIPSHEVIQNTNLLKRLI